MRIESRSPDAAVAADSPFIAGLVHQQAISCGRNTYRGADGSGFRVASLIEAGRFVRTLEQRQGMKICCPEEIAYNMGYISQSRVKGLARSLRRSGYGTYLETLIDS
jgi:dTDP-glucose pyrophosphorylase